MVGESHYDHEFQLGPTPDDMARFAAACSPLAEFFRQSDGCPLRFPELQPGQQLIFDYDYDGEAGDVRKTFTVVDSHDRMMKLWTAVRWNIIGAIGWRVITEPKVDGATADGY